MLKYNYIVLLSIAPSVFYYNIIIIYMVRNIIWDDNNLSKSIVFEQSPGGAGLLPVRLYQLFYIYTYYISGYRVINNRNDDNNNNNHYSMVTFVTGVPEYVNK